jgi:hypothetical protein
MGCSNAPGDFFVPYLRTTRIGQHREDFNLLPAIAQFSSQQDELVAQTNWLANQQRDMSNFSVNNCMETKPAAKHRARSDARVASAGAEKVQLTF